MARVKVPESKVPPARVQFLNAAAELTDGARDRSYGPPSINLKCSGNLKREIRRAMVEAGVTLSPACLDALDNVLQKVARVATGPSPSADTFIDMAAYAAIAGECY